MRAAMLLFWRHGYEATSLADMRLGITQALAHRIAADGITAAQPLALHVMAVIQGMSTLARDGGTREDLLAVAEMAMAAWPA